MFYPTKWDQKLLWVDGKPPFSGTVTCQGRYISALQGDLPTWHEMLHGLGGLSRFCGQQINRKLDWNVLKHSIAVAILCKNFLVGILHDYSEMFTGDIPTPYKTPEIRAFEKKAHRRLLDYLACIWPGFSAEKFLDYPYKAADCVLLEVEADFLIQTPDEYKHIFKYDIDKYNIPYDKKVVRSLCDSLVEIPTDHLFSATKGFLEEWDSIFQENGFSQKLINDSTKNFIELFDFDKIARERVRRSQ